MRSAADLVSRALEGRWPRPSFALVASAWLALAVLGVVLPVEVEAAAAQRFSAPISVTTAAPFVQLDLPVEAYARAEHADLRDLRIVDARGERVPFAFLQAPTALQQSEKLREATLYPLPAKAAVNGDWPAPVDVVVEGDRISVSRRAPAAAGGGARNPPARSGGWLIDLGERARDEPAPSSVRIRWSGPAEFTASYRLEASDDLRRWRAAGTGQLMALQSTAGALTQPTIALADGARFLRLLWLDPAEAPAVSGAVAVVPEQHLVAAAPLREIAASGVAATIAAQGSVPARRALDVDLGATLPLVDVELRFAAGTHVAPVVVQGRSRADEPWRELGAGVFYRLERGGRVGESPALALPVSARQLRFVVDERAAPLDPARTSLVAHAALATIVFATQGEAPFRLLAGARDASAGALPVGTLVPRLDEERPRFGRAALGAFAVVEAAEREAERSARDARLKPWLLWAVLGVGVLVLGLLVWRLARSAAPEAPSPPSWREGQGREQP